MTEYEKRGAPRIPYIAEVVCEGASTRLIARTSDVSISGVFIHSKLCCEPGSILKLKFSVTPTEIETIGEVCYSIPQIGMGIRFLDLKPEHRAAIERLFEKQRQQSGCEETRTQRRGAIPSGVAPVDKLLGGLERGHLYLVHGEASGKSLFGIEFLIEGLKHGQNGALVTPFSSDDAVRRFARIGYDCRDDLGSGRLVICQCPKDATAKPVQMGDLAPLLEKLESALVGASPERLVFDPVNNLLACEKQDAAARATALAVWARSFGATVMLIASGEQSDVVESLTHSAKESFRFDVRETCDRVARFIAFEKSPDIQDQSIRVDPSRGICLVEDQRNNDSNNDKSEMTAEFDWVEAGSTAAENEGALTDVQTSDHKNKRTPRSKPILTEDQDGVSVAAADPEKHDQSVTDSSSSRRGRRNSDSHKRSAARPVPPSPAAAGEEQRDAFSAMLDELQSFVSSLDPEAPETERRPPSRQAG